LQCTADGLVSRSLLPIRNVGNLQKGDLTAK
jgi:hypothetical protein